MVVFSGLELALGKPVAQVAKSLRKRSSDTSMWLGRKLVNLGDCDAHGEIL